MSNESQNNKSDAGTWFLLGLLALMFWRFPKITLALLAGAVLVVVIMALTAPEPKSYDANDYLPPSQRCPRTEYVAGQPQQVDCAGAELAKWQELQDKLDRQRAADADAEWQKNHPQ